MDSFWSQSAVGVLKAITFVYDIATLPVYFLFQRQRRRRRDARRVTIVKEDDNQITLRTISCPGKIHLEMIKSNINTLERVLNYAAQTHGEKNCLGTRQILSEEDEIQPNGQVFKKYNMGEYKWKSFAEVEKLATWFGRGLREHGQEPSDNIVIFAETRAEWIIAAQGCFKQNMRIVTVYATLGDEGVIHCINETEVTTIITSHDLLPKIKALLGETPNVKTIIYMEDQLRKTDTSGFNDIVALVPFSQILRTGSQSRVENVCPTPDDVAIIMYTSGSTGTPKGVLLSHSNLIATLKGFCDGIGPDSNDVFLGLLPLAHVLELLTENTCLLSGVPIGYSSPLTILDSSSKIMKGCKGDATVLRPTFMISVPLMLDRIARGISEKISSAPPLQRSVFKFCYDYKVKWTARGYNTPIVDLLIFKKVAQLLGGRVWAMVSGGAPLSPDTHEKIKMCMLIDLLQGYGLTETTSGATLTDDRDKSYGRVGIPITGADVRLINWEEGNYKVKNRPYPQGEIVIGGDMVSLGYYKLPSKTKEDFFEEDGKRWFRTGDIGEIHEDGVLKIIDRKKDLLKLQSGEYVSLGKIEAELKTCPIVDNICVYGESSKRYTVALIVPSPNALQELAAKYCISSQNFEDLCTSPVLRKAFHIQIEEHAKKRKLTKFEIPGKVALCKEVWTPENGLVTATLKLKRKIIQEKYQNEINTMYSS